MEIYLLQEKIQIVKWCYSGQSSAQIIDSFMEKFVGRPIPSITTIRRIINNFETHGCVTPFHHKKEPPENTDLEERDILICSSVEENKNITLREIAVNCEVAPSTAQKVLRKHGYKPYKLHKSNEIFPEDRVKRMEFCEAIMEKANNDENFIKNILFTDESSFPLLGRHNPILCTYWSKENLHLTYDAGTQYPQKLNVWSGIVGNHIIGPIFIEGNLNSNKYLDLLRNEVIPRLQNLDDVRMEDIWMQQDGCPCHLTPEVREYLNMIFPGKVIDGRSNLPFPPRSPDLTPCDYFLWGHIKNSLYGFAEDRATNLDELRMKIRNSMQSISPETLANVRRNFYDRLGFCLAVEGGRFEHLI